MTFTIADYLLARLRELGVRHIFGVPGDFNLWFMERIQDADEIEYVGCCNELNASYAADGAAHLAGTSALVTTYGVGELAALAGVAGSYAERVSVVCITGTPPLYSMRQRALVHHTLADGDYSNMMRCFREFTVAQALIEPMTAREEIDRALRLCHLEKRPVYLQLPSDVAGVPTSPVVKRLDLRFPSSEPGSLRRAVEAVTQQLMASCAPAILVDADVDRFGLAGLVERVAEKHSLPIAYVAPAKGVISSTHPRLVGMYRGAGSSAEVRKTVEGSDCLVCIGVRFTDVATGLFTHNLMPGAQIHLHSFSVSLQDETIEAVSPHGLLRAVLDHPPLRAAMRNQHNGHTAIEKQISLPGESEKSLEGATLTQSLFWQGFEDFIKPGDVIVADTGTSYFSASNLTLPPDVSFIGQPIWGALGFGLPAILGTAVSEPGRRQILVLGDGGLQMSVQELSTILRLGLKPIIFLLNNDGYTIERLIFGADSRYNDIHPWRYGKIPAALNDGERTVFHQVTTVAELEKALLSSSSVREAHLIEVILPRMDAPASLVRFGRRVREFDFPQIKHEQLDADYVRLDCAEQ
jgi:indolepyruvate decarboxylase